MSAELPERYFDTGEKPVYSLFSDDGYQRFEDAETFWDSQVDQSITDEETSVLDYDQVKVLSDQIQQGLAAEVKLAKRGPPQANSDLEQIVQCGVRAQGELIDHNLALVRYIVNKFINIGVSGAAYNHFEDMIAVGDMSLLLAVRTYNPSLGYEFSTYAVPVIRNGITTYLSQMRGPISYSKQPAVQQRQLRRETKIFIVENERFPNESELIEVHNAWVAKEAHKMKNPDAWRKQNTINASRLKKLRVARQVSLSAIAQNNDSTEAEALDYLTIRTAKAAEDVGMDHTVRSIAHAGLVRAFTKAKLSPMQRRIMYARLTDEGMCMSSNDLAKMLETTQEIIQHNEKMARRKLRTQRMRGDLRSLLDLYDQD